jgi:hypothetical protein
MAVSGTLARLISSFDLIYLAHIESLLKQAGITVQQRNFLLSAGAGEIPFIDVMPELWVSKDEYDRAQKIVEQLSAENDSEREDSWQCPRCHEQIEGQYAQCWHCGYLLSEKHKE